MKRIILTESQYKRLVRQNLNEQRVVYENPKDEKDINYDMFTILDSVAYNLGGAYKKKLYVKKIEDGKVYIDKTKYTQEEIDYIRKGFKNLVNMNLSNVDKMFTNDSDLGFDSGVDSDYDWGDEDITVIDDEGTAEIEDDESTAEVVDISYCDYGVNSKGQKRKFVPPPSMDIKFYQDILKSIGANVTCQKMLFFYAWRTGESSKSSYNPFATTQPNEVNEGCYYNCLKSGEGYTPVGCRECPSGTSPGVRNYKTYKSGLKNTVKTLTNGRYNNVVTKLKNDNITAEEIAGEKSELKTWGTGGLVLDILKYNEKIKPTPISKYGDDPQYVLPDDEEILDCENCLTKIQTKSYDENVNDENVKDFRWWINQDSNRLKSVTDKLKECCETKSDPTISTSYNKKNEWTLVAFSVVGNEWINSGKPKRTFEILDIDETNLIKPSSNYGDSRDYGWRDPIPSLCNEGKTMYCTKHWHGGEDYPYPTGTEIYVFQPGEVIEKGDWTLKIKHDDGSKTRYVHCDEFFVEKGDRIESGTLIGTVGNKGPTTGSHLHFEYWKPNENKTSNPKDIEDNYIRFKL
jgi:murein DD-endopeptidase MepM/ murein hydrolase activator NlpD